MDSSRKVSWRIALMLLWVLVNMCCCWNCCQGRCLHQEMTALLNVKNSISFPIGSALSDWEGEGCCQWSGVSCNNSSSSQVIGIDLSYASDGWDTWHPNASLFSEFKDLKYLNLSGNNIRGLVMPQGLCKLWNLESLDLSSNRLGGSILLCLSNLQSLQYLDLSSNQLKGNIPFSLFNNLTSILQIDLSLNQFYSISFSISTSSLVFLDISSNNIHGMLPDDISLHFPKLSYFNMSHNNFGGPIPESFKNMKQIESLDLSFNQLNGTIPPTLIQLHFLSTFSVAHNNLTGRIPDDKYQFATFDASSYVGNVGLCGEALDKSCSTISGAATDKKENGKPFSDYIRFYLTAEISFILGFCGIILLLYFNKDLGRKYFEAVDVCIDYCVLQFQLILFRICNFQFK